MGLFTTNFDIFSYFYECYAPCEQSHKIYDKKNYQTGIESGHCG